MTEQHSILKTYSYDEFKASPEFHTHREFLRDKRRRKASCYNPETIVLIESARVSPYSFSSCPTPQVHLEGRLFFRETWNNRWYVFFELNSDALIYCLTVNDNAS